MIVTRGPAIWKVPGTDGLVLAVATAAGSPSISANFPFRFTKPVFVAGALVLVRPAAGLTQAQFLARTANVGLRIIDEKQQPLMTDTRGTLRGANFAPVASGLLMLHGKGFAPYALQRPITTERQVSWTFSFQNEDPANAITLAGAFLYIEPAHAQAARRVA